MRFPAIVSFKNYARSCCRAVPINSRVWRSLLGATGLFACLSVKAALVLQYHHVSDDSPPSTSISPSLFKKHMAYLADNHFAVVPLNALVQLLRDGKNLPDKTVAITFDDAYESVYETAYPLLEARGWPFTVFVNTDPLDKHQAGFVTWDQLREMAKHDVTIANHTTNHHHLLRLKKDENRKQWRKRISEEILLAEQRIKEETGQDPKILAYPYGEYDQWVQTLVKQLDYIAFGQQSGPLAQRESLQALPRFPFGGHYVDMKEFVTKVNTRPLALNNVQLFSGRQRKEPLPDVILEYGQRPVLLLSPRDKKLLDRIQCFASGQGAIATERQGDELLVQANKPLPAGRTRYNCTALSDQSGRFYWFSQQWLSKGKSGKWEHEPGL